ncbi:hypothetical protein Tco_0536541, partial [Tanacetum coccineum]
CSLAAINCLKGRGGGGGGIGEVVGKVLELDWLVVGVG